MGTSQHGGGELIPQTPVFPSRRQALAELGHEQVFEARGRVVNLGYTWGTLKKLMPCPRPIKSELLGAGRLRPELLGVGGAQASVFLNNS